MIQKIVFPLYKLTCVIFSKRIILKPLSNTKSILISNHISYLDPFLIVGSFTFSEFKRAMPFRAITSNTFLYGKPFSPLLRALGCYPSKPHGDEVYGLQASIKYAKDSTIIIFPEGARSTVHEIKRLRTGAAVIANNVDTPILPFFVKRSGLRFKVVRGEQFDGSGMTVDQMMQNVWNLEKKI